MADSDTDQEISEIPSTSITADLREAADEASRDNEEREAISAEVVESGPRIRQDAIGLITANKLREFISKYRMIEDNENEVQRLLKVRHNGQISRDPLMKCLYNIVCVLACESVSSEPCSKKDLSIRTAVHFDKMMDSMEVTEEFISGDGLLTYFPNRKWPRKFHEFVDDKKSKDGSTDGVVKFGEAVRSEWTDSKKGVIAALNLWLPPSSLPSGFQPSQWLYYMRSQFFLVHAKVRAKQSASQHYRRQRAKGLPLTEPKKRNDVFDGKYFPEFWLTFLFLSDPVGESRRRSFFNKASATTSEQMRQGQSKSVRNDMDSSTPSHDRNVRQKISPETGKGEQVVIHRHIVEIQQPAVQKDKETSNDDVKELLLLLLAQMKSQGNVAPELSARFSKYV